MPQGWRVRPASATRAVLARQPTVSGPAVPSYTAFRARQDEPAEQPAHDGGGRTDHFVPPSIGASPDVHEDGPEHGDDEPRQMSAAGSHGASRCRRTRSAFPICASTVLIEISMVAAISA